MRALAVVLALAGSARADLAPPRAPVPARFVLDDELKTHAPPPEQPRRDAPAARAPEAPIPIVPPGPPPTAEREAAGPEQPLDFVDATLETPDLAARFTSSRPAWKRVPKTFRHARAGSR